MQAADFQDMFIPAFRLAEPDDALCVSVLAMQVFLDTYALEGIRPSLARGVLHSYSESHFQEVIEDSNTQILLAEHSGHLIGFAEIAFETPCVQLTSQRQCELRKLYVQRRFIGKQVGTQLLAHAEEQAGSHGALLLWLTAWIHNRRAIDFYTRHGYGNVGFTTFRIEDESHENILFVKDLR